MDLKAFYKLSYGLYIVSSCDQDRQSGCIVNTLTQVTAEPVQLAVTVNKDNFTKELVEKSGFFTGVDLTESADMDLIGTFGFRSGKTENKFEKFPVKQDLNGVFYVTQDVAARFSCKVVKQLDLDTHVMFIGEVQEAETLSEDDVMTYAYYQQVKKGTTPKNAPSYKGEETQKKGYRCSICGYVLESDTLPPDFICPICKQGADKFVKL